MVKNFRVGFKQRSNDSTGLYSESRSTLVVVSDLLVQNFRLQ
jgi:hypothetical protein